VVVGVVVATGSLELLPVWRVTPAGLAAAFESIVAPTLHGLQLAFDCRPCCCVVVGSTCCKCAEGDAAAYVAAQHARAGLVAAANEDAFGLPLRAVLLQPGNLLTPLWSAAGAAPPPDSLPPSVVADDVANEVARFIADARARYVPP
jgi:hypothetical protein